MAAELEKEVAALAPPGASDASLPNANPQALAGVQNPLSPMTPAPQRLAALGPSAARPASDPYRPTSTGLYSYLVGRGATRNEALMLTGAATSESGLNPTATHDKDANGNPTGYGLFGHRLERRDAMFRATGSNAPNWQQQAEFALKELRTRPESAMLARAQTPSEITAAQMHYERPKGYTPDNPQGGDNYAGRLAAINNYWTFDGSNPPAALPVGLPGAPGAPGAPGPQQTAQLQPPDPEPAAPPVPPAGIAPVASAAPLSPALAPSRPLAPKSSRDLYMELLKQPTGSA